MKTNLFSYIIFTNTVSYSNRESYFPHILKNMVLHFSPVRKYYYAQIILFFLCALVIFQQIPILVKEYPGHLSLLSIIANPPNPLLSICNENPSEQGTHQKVISFSLHANQIPYEIRTTNMSGIWENFRKILELYLGWRIRIYTNVSKRNKEYLQRSSDSANVSICDVTSLPVLGEYSGLGETLWQFLPILDPTVDIFVVGDLDNVATAQRRASVKEWEESEDTFYTNEGVWGAKNYLFNDETKSAIRYMFSIRTGKHRSSDAPVMHGISTSNRETILKETLEQAELIWKQGVAVRHKMEEVAPIPEHDPWPLRNGVMIWDFFYPNFNCPHMVERVGRGGDGGKWVCGISHLAQYQKSCIVYSFGVGWDISFEREIIDRTNCIAHLHDYSVFNTRHEEKLGLRTSCGSKCSFTQIGLGSQNLGTMRTLKFEMEEKGDTFIDILKVDIEGAEFEAFRQIIKDFPDQLPFGQLLIEIHLTSLPSIGLYRHLKEWWEALENAGLRAFRNEINLNDLLLGSKKSAYYEVSFLNVRGNHTLLHY